MREMMTLLQEPKILKRTPLYDRHVSLAGKMVDFSGWSLPVYYTSILAEHQWTRSSCSFFDVSHLGEIAVSGPDALEHLQKKLTCDIRKAKKGEGIVYGVLCNERGGSLDDILVYAGEAGDYHLVVNASNIEKDFQALKKAASARVNVENNSDNMACVAVQGPKSETILEKLFGFKLKDMRYYSFRPETLRGQRVWLSRTGYTGEDGFEIFSANDLAGHVWDRLAEGGKALGALPAGLGARNTLRLEAGNVLYGHELDEETTPLEAGIRFAVSFTKGDFTGRSRLLEQKEKGVPKHLVGFKMKDRSIPRDGYAVLAGGKTAGRVTSGSFAPTVGLGIGMAFVAPGLEAVGTGLGIEIHGRVAEAEVVPRPFVAPKHRKG